MILPNDFVREYASIQDEVERKVLEVLRGGWYILGEEVRGFEDAFADYLGTGHCVGVANGLEAIFLILKALDIGQGDEVILPSNTYIASALAVSHAGATPVFAEPDIRTHNLDPLGIEARITSRTRAILPVHLYGLCSDMPAIRTLADRYDLAVIEDCAQAHGSRVDGRMAGTFGDAAAFSFYPTKNLGAYGDAGAVVCRSRDLADKVAVLRNYGSRQRYYNEVIGYNSRLDELQAAILRIKLKYLDDWNRMRREAAGHIRSRLSDKDWRWQEEPAGCHHVYHQLIAMADDRTAAMAEMESIGWKCLIHYPVPPYRSDAYKASFTGMTFPIADEIAGSIFSLPLHGIMWSAQ